MNYFFIASTGILTVILVILMVVSWWIIYDKMGVKGWKCLIPFYGKYVLFERVWEAKIYFIFLVLNVTLCSLFNIAVRAVMETMSSGHSNGLIGIILFVTIFFLVTFLLQLILNWRFVKCFGYGIGFFLGITFLPIVFIPFIAFGSSYYDYY